MARVVGLPDAGCRQPDAGCRMPDAASRMPPAGCRQPDAASRMPPAGCRQLDAGCHQPDAGCRMPDAGCRMPDARATPNFIFDHYRKLCLPVPQNYACLASSSPAPHPACRRGPKAIYRPGGSAPGTTDRTRPPRPTEPDPHDRRPKTPNNARQKNTRSDQAKPTDQTHGSKVHRPEFFVVSYLRLKRRENPTTQGVNSTRAWRA